MSEQRTDYYHYCTLLQERINDGQTSQSLLRMFIVELQNRLALGEKLYADKSSDAPFVDLLGEVAKTDLDRAGWSFVLWRKATQLLAVDQEPNTRRLLEHLIDEAMGCAHRAYGAWERDNGSMVVASAALDLKWPTDGD